MLVCACFLSSVPQPPVWSARPPNGVNGRWPCHPVWRVRHSYRLTLRSVLHNRCISCVALRHLVVLLALPHFMQSIVSEVCINPSIPPCLVPLGGQVFFGRRQEEHVPQRHTRVGHGEHGVEQTSSGWFCPQRSLRAELRTECVGGKPLLPVLVVLLVAASCCSYVYGVTHSSWKYRYLDMVTRSRYGYCRSVGWRCPSPGS